MINRYSPFYPLYLWTQRALPLVISGDLEIIDLIRHLMTSIAEISESIEININYEELVQQIINNEEFYETFKQYINNYIGGKEGLGNIIGYHTEVAGRYSLGVAMANTSTNIRAAQFSFAFTDISGTYRNVQLSYCYLINISGYVYFNLDLRASLGELTSSRVPDGPLECKMGWYNNPLSDSNLEKFYKHFVPYTDRPFYSMPYGDADNYFIFKWNTIEDVKANREIEGDNYTRVITMYTSGQALRSIPIVSTTSLSDRQEYYYATFASTYWVDSGAHLEISNADMISFDSI